MKKISLIIAFLVVSCASVPSSADIDFKYKVYMIDTESGDYVRRANVCIKNGIFGKCKQYELQVIERQANTKEFRQKLVTAQFVLMAQPDLLPITP